MALVSGGTSRSLSNMSIVGPQHNVLTRDAHSFKAKIGTQRRISFHVNAGLNYPHMPNRLRRQRQELAYKIIRVRDKATSTFLKSPVGQNFIVLWEQVLQFLSPVLTRIAKIRDDIKWFWREQLLDFYDFTMDETKRKYKWEAYSEQEKKWWIDTLTFIGERLAVLIGYAAFITAVPSTMFWTFLLPIFIATTNLRDDKKNLWPYFCLVLIIMQPLKHNFREPIRWFL